MLLDDYHMIKAQNGIIITKLLQYKTDLQWLK